MINFKHGVFLQPLNPENSEVYRKARNDYSTWRWCRQHDLISTMQQSRWVDAQDQDKTIMMYEILDINNDVMGVCGFTDIDHFNQRAEFSLYIIPGNRGRGHAEAGLRTLFDHGFWNLNFNMIWGEVFEGNGAMKLFEKIGMKNTGYRPDFYFKHGKFIDAHFFCIKREEWTTQQ